MKVAFLVLASIRTDVLKCTIELLKSKDVKFFIHVDRKFDIEKFLALATDGSVTILQERRNIFWGGFSMVLAEIALLKAAVAENFERMVLISDDSFPLKSISKLREALQPNSQWIGTPSALDSWATERYLKFYYFDSHATNPKRALWESGKFEAGEIHALRDLVVLMERGKKPIGQVFHGKQWWALTKDAAEYVLDVHKNDDHLRESFRFSAVPDEQYIQTIVGNAPQEWNHRPSFMWTDFSRNPKPYVFTSAKELEEAFSSDYLFVRKVSEDPDLLTCLASQVHGTE